MPRQGVICGPGVAKAWPVQHVVFINCMIALLQATHT
jgi:hypothetical protein